MRLVVLLVASLWFGFAGGANAQTRDRYFLSSDGVRLHYLDAGPAAAHTIVFVPGWTMPAWIWAAQIDAFSARYHVVAFDPRGQGDSEAPVSGYEPIRRGRDITDLLGHLGPAPVVVVAWSLGVLDTLASIHNDGDRQLAGLVLVDNSVGEEPAPTPHPVPRHKGPAPSRADAMRQFVQAMFERPMPPTYLERLTETCLRTPAYASRALLSYPMPRSYWRDAVYATHVPLLYTVRPRWAEQGENLMRYRGNTELEVFSSAGHALFVDEPARFNQLVDSFLRRRVWP